MLYYVPLEPYVERYTGELAKPNTGWIESALHTYSIPYVRIEGKKPKSNRITTGRVLDTIGRCEWALSQMQEICKKFRKGEIDKGSQFYFDDMFHPGIEALYYIDPSVKVYVYCWAQSFDQHDFTRELYPEWMPAYEEMVMRSSPIPNYNPTTTVFVANSLLKDLIKTRNPVADVRVVGLPFGITHLPNTFASTMRKNRVVFSSRLNEEKQPHLFYKLAEKLPEIEFVISCPRNIEHVDPKYTQSPTLPNMTVRYGITKDDYYTLLNESKFQFNCALQDWVSYTLLEAVTLGCYPIYPNFRSFPETFQRRPEMLYPAFDMDAAANLIRTTMEKGVYPWSWSSISERFTDLVDTHTRTTERIAKIIDDKFYEIHPKVYKTKGSS